MDRIKPETPGTSPAQDTQNRQKTPGSVSGEEKIDIKTQERNMEMEVWQDVMGPQTEVTDEGYEHIKWHFEILQISWNTQDYAVCKKTLQSICEDITFDQFQSRFLTYIPKLVWVWTIFKVTGIHETLDNASVKAFYADLCNFPKTRLLLQMQAINISDQIEILRQSPVYWGASFNNRLWRKKL